MTKHWVIQRKSDGKYWHMQKRGVDWGPLKEALAFQSKDIAGANLEKDERIVAVMVVPQRIVPRRVYLSTKKTV